MAAQIILDQGALPPGTPGQAREDFVTGVDVVATAFGGPFLAHSWSFFHRPIDIFTPVRASTLIAAPAAPVTTLTPIDVAGTYGLELRVDSGSGLGANADDVARITFYAGPALNALPDRMPRRIPAFLERLEHNVPDALDPAGNPEGWSREWYRWFGLIQRLWDGRSWCAGRVALPGGGPAALTRGFNVALVTRTGLGTVRVDFAIALPDANYAVVATARGATGGSCTVNTELAGSFVVERADLGGALVDADFNFDVKLGA
jgi:hypothetical protein